MEKVGLHTIAMNLVRVVAASILLTAGVAYAAASTQVLGIKLQDPSTDSSIEHMRIVLDQAKVKSGRVTLHAENQSKNLVHEVVIAHDDGADELPLDANHDLVIETRVRSVGEIANLMPGGAGNLTLTLQPGAYILFCNLPGHYLDGMIAKFTVVP